MLVDTKFSRAIFRILTCYPEHTDDYYNHCMLGCRFARVLRVGMGAKKSKLSAGNMGLQGQYIIDKVNMIQ